MAQLFRREFRPSPVEQELPRSTQSSTVYLLDLFSRRKHLFVLALLAVTALVFVLHPKRTYSAKNILTIQPLSLSQGPQAPSMEVGSLMGSKDNVRDRQITFLNSFEFKRMAAKEFMQVPEFESLARESQGSLKKRVLRWLGVDQKFKKTETLFAEKLQESIKASPNNDTNIQIEVFHQNYQIAEKLSSFLVQFALKAIKVVQIQNVELSRQSLQTQISTQTQEIENLTTELQAFKRDNKIISTAAIPEDLRNSLSNLSRNLVEAEIKLQETNFLLTQTQAQLERERVAAEKSGQAGYIDQVLMLKIQEFKETRDALEAKIKGTRNILKKENSRFEFYATGEEMLSSLRFKMTTQLEALAQLEQKLKQTELLRDQIDQSMRVIGETYVHQRAGQFPLILKLIVLNLFALFLTGMGIFYWYEVFPVISYRDENIVKMNLLSFPQSAKGGFGKGLPRELITKAERLFAKNLVGRLGKSGFYQFFSISPREGKTHILSVVADYLDCQGASVTIVDLSGKGSYPRLSRRIKIVSNKAEVQSILSNPQHIAELSSQSDWVLVDGHSLAKDISHMLVSSQMDGIILIGSYLETKSDQFVDWRLKLEHMASPSVHFVLNKTNLREDIPFLLKAQMKKEKTSTRKVA